MHAKASAKAEEKEIRSLSKVSFLPQECAVFFVLIIIQALKERTEGKPVPVKGNAKSTKQQRKQIENARQMSGSFFAAKRKARLDFFWFVSMNCMTKCIFFREARDRDRKSSGGGGGKSSSPFVKGGIGKKSVGGGVKPQHSGGRRGLK